MVYSKFFFGTIITYSHETEFLRISKLVRKVCAIHIGPRTMNKALSAFCACRPYWPIVFRICCKHNKGNYSVCLLNFLPYRPQDFHHRPGVLLAVAGKSGAAIGLGIHYAECRVRGVIVEVRDICLDSIADIHSFICE